MSFLKYILFIGILFHSTFLQSQNAKEFNTLAKEYLKISLDSADLFADKALDLAIQNNNNSEIAYAHKNKGIIWYYRNNKEQAIKAYKKSINYFDKAQEFEESSNLYHNLGLVYYKMGYTKESSENYHLSISTRKKINLTEGLEGTYNGLAVLYQDMSLFDSASYYLNLSYALTSKTDTPRLSYLYNSIGRNFLYQSLHDSALYYYSKAYEIKKSLNDSISLGLAIENIGLAFSSKSNYDTAISCYFMALEIYDRFGDIQAQARAYSNIGSLYFDIRDTTNSEKYYLKSLKIHIDTKNIVGQARIYNSLGLIMQERKKYEHASQYYLKSAAILKRENKPRELADVYQNLSDISLKKKQYSNAIHYLNKSNEIAKKHNIIYIFYANNYALANIYNKQNKNYKALEYLSFRENPDAQKYLDKTTFLESLHLVSNIYSKQGRYKDAYTELAKYLTLYKGYLNEKLFTEVANINTKYETEKIEKENELYRKQSKIEKLKLENQEQEIKANKVVIFSILAILLAAFFALFFLFRTSRERKTFNKKLIDKNHLISEQNHEIERQLDLLEEHKKILEAQKEEITDSINYAKRFQTAIIPNEEKVKSIFPNSFVLYKPRDIVSGDFYYVYETKEYKYFVAADCTGHGVPGAFLSIIGHNGLSGALTKFGLTDLSDIMKFLNQYLFDFLNQNQKMEINDGIDMTIIRVDEEKREISYAGAYNPLILIRENKLHSYKTNKFSVGSSKNNTFETHTISYQNNDIIFLFSDGYADQFGGPKGKKFMKKHFYQLLTSISTKPPHEQERVLKESLENWMKFEEQIDDILVAGIFV